MFVNGYRSPIAVVGAQFMVLLEVFIVSPIRGASLPLFLEPKVSNLRSCLGNLQTISYLIKADIILEDRDVPLNRGF